MKVTAPKDLAWVTPLERGMKAGEVVDTTDEVAEGLLAQGWTRAERPSTPKTSKSTEASSPTSAKQED